jgi:hypothetical protein
MANRKQLVLATTQAGCIVPTSHKLNADGYFRKSLWVGGKLKPMMYHRYKWQEAHGEIPNGYEVDHKCKNRACCNVEHLQLLLSTEHRTKDNTGRNADRKQMAHRYWLTDTSMTGIHLSERFAVSFSAACKWIREWKQ